MLFDLSSVLNVELLFLFIQFLESIVRLSSWDFLIFAEKKHKREYVGVLINGFWWYSVSHLTWVLCEMQSYGFLY